MTDLTPQSNETKLSSRGLSDAIKEVPQSHINDFETGEIEKITVQDTLYYGLDSAYVAKAQLFSEALTSIGMTKWQYKMWAVCGFGWIVDNIAGYGLSVTYTPVGNEFVVTNVALLGISYNIGAFIGALFWGLMADIIGRKYAFNITLFLVGIFLIAAGGVNSIYAYGAMFGMVGFASGGNVPVASTVYLEFVPSSGYYLLTILSAWWAVGAVVDAVVAWVFVSKYSCDLKISDLCLKADNMGWRYTLFTVGAIVLFFASLRAFVFRLPESPYFLLSIGRDQEALDVLQYIAEQSEKPCNITIEHLTSINDQHGISNISAPNRTFMEIFLAQFKELSFSRLKPLFGKPKLALQTSLIIWIWAAVGVAYPLYSSFLPLYLVAKFKAISYDYSTAATYKSYCYIAACTVPGPIFAGWAVDTRLGRRYSMAIGTVLSGVFLYVSTRASTDQAVVGLNCAVTIVINFFFAIQYAYTPESFPSTIRATATGMCSMIGYVCGMAAPIISSQAGVATNTPIYVSGGLFLITGVLMFALPIETATEKRL